ncbi:MAG: PAS domain S-box protein [Nitrospirae bacterium]|nr:PAS domain S-box protein [Nitrospirota bacterium]
MFKGIQGKIILLAVTIGLLPGIVGVILTYFGGTNLLKNSIVNSLQEIAKMESAQVNRVIEKKIHEARSLTISPFVRRYIETANQRYAESSNEDLIKEINRIESIWPQLSEKNPFLKAILNNELSAYLKEYKNLEKEEYAEIFITDVKGAVIAATNKTTDFFQADEKWWEEAYNGGKGSIYLSDVSYDESAKVFSLDFCLPIMDRSNKKVIGIVKIVTDIRYLFSGIINIRIGKTGHSDLVASDGTVIIDAISPPLSWKISEGLISNISTTEPGWTIDVDEHGIGSIIGYAPVEGSSAFSASSFGNKRWYIFIRQDMSEVYIPIMELLWRVSLIGLVLVCILAFVALSRARQIVKPLMLLQNGIELIGQGRLNYRLEVETKDEVGQLANSINKMAAEMEDSTNKLELQRRELEETKNYLKNILEYSADIVITTDLNGNVVEFNKAAEEILEYKKEEVIGRPADEFYLDKNERKNILEIVNKKGKINNFETRFMTRSGKILNVSLTLSHLKDNSGRLIGTVGISRDVTVKKELDQMKLDFMYMLTHDIKSPLSILLGLSTMVMEGKFGSVDEKIVEPLRSIYSSGRKISSLVDNCLTSALIEAGRLELEMKPVKLDLVLNNIIKLMRLQAAKKMVDIRTDIPKSFPEVIGDEIYLDRVFINLLSNAIKYTPDGGEIRVKGRITDSGKAKYHKRYAEISISDTGIGISQEDLSGLFNKYKRAKGSRRIEGTGLGLFIVKYIVDSHNGEVEVSSKVGEGSAFTVRFPLKGAKTA